MSSTSRCVRCVLGVLTPSTSPHPWPRRPIYQIWGSGKPQHDSSRRIVFTNPAMVEKDTGWNAVLENRGNPLGMKKLKRWSEAVGACAEQILPSSSSVPPPALVSFAVLTVSDDVDISTMKRVSRRVRVMKRTVKRISQILTVRRTIT